MPIASGASDVFQNITSPEHILTAANSPTDGMFGITVFGVIWIILIFVMMSSLYGRTNGDKEAFLASSIVMIPITILMIVLELINVTISVLPVVASVIGLMILARVSD